MSTVDSTKADVKGGTALRCVVITPEKKVLDEVADFLALPLDDGELGVLPGRAPLIGRLGYGELRTKSGGATHRYFVDGGFAQVRDDEVTVLTNRAIPVEQLDPAAAAEEFEAAQARTAAGPVDREAKSRAVDRARSLVWLAGRK